MARLIKDKGVIALAKVILNLAEQTGYKYALDTIESSPSVFVDLLLNKNLISEKLSENKTSKKTIANWFKQNVVSNIEKLKLTPYQALILFSILKYKNSATLSDLIGEFEKRKIKVKTGSMIGGSLAGISKKCVSYGISEVFKTIKGKNNQDIYVIIPTAESTLQMLKKCLKQFIDDVV